MKNDFALRIYKTFVNYLMYFITLIGVQQSSKQNSFGSSFVQYYVFEVHGEYRQESFPFL